MSNGTCARRWRHCFTPTRTWRDSAARATPAAKARPAPAVRLKRAARKSEDSPSLRRRDGLISALSTLARNTCRAGEGKTAVRFTRNTAPGAYRLRVFELLKCDGPAWLVKCAQ
jgi:hypothetical protein